uniref:Uncharacterized protein n=1 Tax=Arundo donax TaxID=35708 RepID=A0A0A8Y4I6_ARUDO
MGTRRLIRREGERVRVRCERKVMVRWDLIRSGSGLSWPGAPYVILQSFSLLPRAESIL